jgi:hypothetical protein
MHLEAPVPLLTDLLPELPQDLSGLVRRLMEKRPQDRPQSAAEVSEILKLLATGGGTSRL